MTVPFSLHCSICIEAFDATERPPVVLPCGHTFLCLQCSKRLKSCMECRTPLFVSRRLPQGPPATVAHRGNSYSRTAHYSGPASPPLRVQGNPTRTTQEAPEALPIPKNLVLLALIEASANLTGVTEDPDKDYESGDDNEQVMEGIDMMATCGTFVVKAKEGLVIDPEHCSDSSIFSTNDKENQEEQLMMKVEIGESSKTFVDEHLLELSICRTHSEEVEVPMFFPNPPALEMAENRLSYGQTCQVVAFQGGTAKLARDLGYIQAKNDELVKIGNPRDEACRLQARLEALSQQRQRLLRKLDRLERTEARVKTELDRAMLSPDPVPFGVAPGFETNEEAKEEEASIGTPPPSPNRSEIYPKALMQTPLTISGSIEQSSSLEYSPTAMPSNVMSPSNPGGCNLPMVLRQENSSLSIPSLGCTIMPSFFDDDSDEDRAPLAEPARPWNNSPPSTTRTVSERSINFRTGMSGHMALTSASSQVHRAMQRRGEVRMMGEHRGIGRIRPQHQRSCPQSPNDLLISPSSTEHIEQPILTDSTESSL